MVPTFTADRSTGSAPSYSPAASPRLRRRPSSWPPRRPRHHRRRSRPPDPRTGVHCCPAHIHQVGAGVALEGVQPLVPHRTPSRLACRTRAVWQCRPVPSLSGLLPPSPAPPGSGCPQLHRPAATGRRWASHPTRSIGASWRTPRSAHQPGKSQGRPNEKPGLKAHRANRPTRLRSPECPCPGRSHRTPQPGRPRRHGGHGHRRHLHRFILDTNAIEALNRQLRKAIKTKGNFPNEDAARKLVYLAINRRCARLDATRNWTNRAAGASRSTSETASPTNTHQPHPDLTHRRSDNPNRDGGKRGHPGSRRRPPVCDAITPRASALTVTMGRGCTVPGNPSLTASKKGA